MNGNFIYGIFSIITILCYIAPAIFIIWFIVKFLKVQNERNLILKSISANIDKLEGLDKIDKQDNLDQHDNLVNLEKEEDQPHQDHLDNPNP